MTIPEIRQRLHEIADETGNQELHMLADETRRKYHGRRVLPRQGSLNPELVQSVRLYAATHPAETMFEIGERFNLNQGRVSEALYGFRS